MIIKGLFRRYKRWNPVHPTCGAFWGMGVGVGCGVGWGPGFGPEVVGYVGAGCGVGFSVGITLAGIGIGLPANFLFHVPYKELGYWILPDPNLYPVTGILFYLTSLSFKDKPPEDCLTCCLSALALFGKVLKVLTAGFSTLAKV